MLGWVLTILGFCRYSNILCLRGGLGSVLTIFCLALEGHETVLPPPPTPGRPTLRDFIDHRLGKALY